MTHKGIHSITNVTCKISAFSLKNVYKIINTYTKDILIQ